VRVYNKEIDATPGTVARRIMAIPLRDLSTGSVIGCMHFINKMSPSDAFTEADELLSTGKSVWT